MGNKSLKNSKEMKTHNFMNVELGLGNYLGVGKLAQLTHIHKQMHVIYDVPAIEGSSFIRFIYGVFIARFSQNN